MKSRVMAVVIKNGYGMENITIENIEKPTIQDNEVLVNVKAASLNQLDLMVAKGVFENKLPHVLGSDAAGMDEQVGSKVPTLKVGDFFATHFIQGSQSDSLKSTDVDTRLGVCVPDVFARYITLSKTSLVKVPTHLTFEEAATSLWKWVGKTLVKQSKAWSSTEELQ